MAYARDRGCLINLVVPGVPDWAQHYDYQMYVESCEWFWSQLEKSFGDQVTVWQVFNEADSMHYRLFTPVELTDAYLLELEDLLQRARGILRSATTTNLTGWPMNDEREQTWVHVLDHLESVIDMVSLNLYPADNEVEIERLPDRLDRIRDRYGKRLFVAELGLQTVPGAWNEADQGRYLSSTLSGLRADTLWGTCMYQLRDEPSPAGFGLLHADGSPKSGFDDIMKALQALRFRA